MIQVANVAVRHDDRPKVALSKCQDKARWQPPDCHNTRGKQDGEDHLEDADCQGTITEYVHSHVRYAKDSYITDCYNRIAKKRDKGKATMAAASKMLRVMHIVLTEKKEYVPHSG